MLRFTQTSRDELLGHVIWDLFPALGPAQEHYRGDGARGPSVLSPRGRLR